MENNKLTVWQRLSQAFGPNSLLGQDYPTYKYDKKELLRTTSKYEYDREKLQAQQNYYLANQWAKIEHNLYTQAVYYEPTRLSSFYDYESMEFTPEISAALDIYAEECTTVDQNGHILQIYSESKRIKGILADLDTKNIKNSGYFFVVAFVLNLISSSVVKYSVINGIKSFSSERSIIIIYYRNYF
jgi:hypothetical protein